MNRNIIIKIEEEIEMHDNFIWLTLGQIKELMHMDNLVNMDTRTVISGISFIYGSFTYKRLSIFLLLPNLFNNRL